jgi:Ca2+:H+ antiporter
VLLVILLCSINSDVLPMPSKLQGLIFLFSMLGITPLAERLGYATE